MNRSSSSTWVKGVVDMFASQGLDVPRLLQCAGIAPAELERPGARLGADTVTRLWDLAVSWSGNPSLGLDRSLVDRYVNFDVVGHAMLSSPDLHSGLKNLARYLALVSDAATFVLQPDARNHWLVLGHTGNTLRVPRQRQEYGMLALLALCQWLTRRPVPAMAVEFAFPPPVSEQPYRLAFDCPMRFGQPATRLLLSAEDLATPLPSRSPAMLALHERVMDEQLSGLGATSIRHKVRDAVMQRLGQGEPRREDIAAHLALTDRTFQRRLRAENTSYQQLLDDARCELARKYLAQESLPLNTIADLLGFGDPSNVFRACKRWFGVSPGEYRKTLTAHTTDAGSLVQ
ncbi:MAG: AraC family transcriptional regulator [Rhodoferax sp.]|nr:AraC family transcriptional regulator [Rhodoferax sp.]